MLAGVSYVLCFPRFDLPALSLLFLPALLFCVHALGESRKQALLLGFLLSAMVAVGGFHWIVFVAQNFGDMPLPAAVGLLALYCLVAAPQMVAFLLLAQHLRFEIERLPLALRPLFWAGLYVALEYAAHFFKIFPENIGNTLLHFLPLAQVASLGGAPLLGFLPLFLGASLFYLRKAGWRAGPSAAAALALVVGAFFWGEREITRLQAAPTENIRIGIVQHNMDEAEKAFARTNVRDVIGLVVSGLLEKTGELTRRDPRPELVVWPETAYPMVFPSYGTLTKGGVFANGYAKLVSGAVAAVGVPLLFGGYLHDQGVDFNAGILLGADGRMLGAYKKQELLIFGEYFPLDRWFPSLKELNPMMGNFGRGPGPEPILFPWKGGQLPVGVNICYEAILPEYMRGYARAGARLFVNLTKDSWFGDTFEPWQHFQLSALRAIEHRLPMVRSTNTGLSGLILPTGETKLLSVPFREAVAVLDVPLPLNPPRTLYTALGEWFAWLMALGCIGLGIYARKRV